ncbi:MAG: hypothetical protein RXS25_12640 [Paraburkholderia sp.]|uniref:hypothetical protein n=1 Tax=Paraburkholderia sp. TaxID=1926495 RepID=UPI00397822DA
MSLAIRRLEAMADFKLFWQVSSRLVPTQEAIALMRDVDRYFVGDKVIEHRIRSLRLYGLGPWAIGSFPALGTGFLPRDRRIRRRRASSCTDFPAGDELVGSSVHEKVSAGGCGSRTDVGRNVDGEPGVLSFRTHARGRCGES